MSRFKLTIPRLDRRFRFIDAWGWEGPKPNVRDLPSGNQWPAVFAPGSTRAPHTSRVPN